MNPMMNIIFQYKQQFLSINISRNFQMELIDNYDIQSHNPNQKFYENFLMAFQNCFKGLVVKFSIDSSNKISLFCFLCKFQRQRILSELSFNQNNEFSIDCTLMNQLLLRCSTHEKRINIIQYFLRQNEKNQQFNFKIHPISGRLSLNMKYNMLDFSSSESRKYAQCFFNNLNNLQIKIKKNFQFISFILDKDFVNLQQNQFFIGNKNLNKTLKTYVNSSAHYAWNIVEGGTKLKSQQKCIYEQKKKKFRLYRKSYKNGRKSHMINETSTESKIQNQPFFVLKIDEDEQLFKNMLSYAKSFNYQTKIVNEITVDTKDLQKIFSRKDVKINTQENGRIYASVQLISKQKLRAQKKILQQLPQQQFIGLPRYYFLKNFQTETNRQYRICSLTNTLNLTNFLERNKESISKSTKIQILNKISNTLRYLKQNQILYHNLQPKNIKLKKGLITKLTDFTNAYCPSVDIPQRKNIFPYVSNINTIPGKTYEEQKSMSYSLGVLMYQTLYEKNPFYIKTSSIINQSQNQIFQRLCSKPLLGIVGQKKLAFNEDKFLFKFILNAINHNFDLQKIKDFDDNQILKSRPYLDWFTIITTTILNHNRVDY